MSRTRIQLYRQTPVSTIVLGAALVLSLSCGGCSPGSWTKKVTKTVTRPFKSSGAGVKKKIAFAPYINTTFITDDSFRTKFQNSLIEALQAECKNLSIVAPGTADYPSFLNDLPRLSSGSIDTYKLAEAGRKSGLFAVSTGGMISISGDHRDKGYLWWKSSDPLIRILTYADVYDTETGAKLLDEKQTHEFGIEEGDVEGIKTKSQAGLLILEAEIDQIGAELAEHICEAMDSQPWKGYIVAADGSEILLSSGGTAGLKTGDVLEIYTTGLFVEGAGGVRFAQRGKKVGKIKITAVAPQSAEGELVSDNPGSVKVGDMVKFKD